MSGEEPSDRSAENSGASLPFEPPLRVLVVDDSAYNRQTITSMLEGSYGVEVVGRATNGKEALKLVFDLDPDVITLDLEMPEMDGFAFLRLLMARKPTPVLIVSGYSQRENVFRALELGALDFIAKPRRGISPDIRDIEQILVRKIGMVRRLQTVRLKQRADSLAAQGRSTGRIVPRQEAGGAGQAGSVALPLTGKPARVVIGVGCSTGGPPAIQQLLCAMPSDFPAAIVIAQHMPARFTRAFADRLDRLLDARVVEVEDGQPLLESVIYIVPGGRNVDVEPGVADEGAVLRIATPVDGAAPKLAPSADHLFETLSAAFGTRFCATILTGMGSDGTAGARLAKARGGRVLAEDPSTAVMPGMPHSVIEAGVVDRAIALERLHLELIAFAERGN